MTEGEAREHLKACLDLAYRVKVMGHGGGEAAARMFAEGATDPTFKALAESELSRLRIVPRGKCFVSGVFTDALTQFLAAAPSQG